MERKSIENLGVGEELDNAVHEALFDAVFCVTRSSMPDVRLSDPEAILLMPCYSTDPADAFQVEERIAALGLEPEYIRALWEVVSKGDLRKQTIEYDNQFRFKHATPEMICRAALKAVREKKES